MKKTIMRFYLIAVVPCIFFQACVDCIGPGNNKKVPAPAEDEFQFIVDNGISREMPVYVNNVKVATVCGESGDTIVGNFKQETCTTFKVYNEADQCWAHVTPCGGLMCQTYCATECFDTTGAEEFSLRLCWEGQCDEEEPPKSFRASLMTR